MFTGKGAVDIVEVDLAIDKSEDSPRSWVSCSHDSIIETFYSNSLNIIEKEESSEVVSKVVVIDLQHILRLSL